MGHTRPEVELNATPLLTRKKKMICHQVLGNVQALFCAKSETGIDPLLDRLELSMCSLNTASHSATMLLAEDALHGLAVLYFLLDYFSGMFTGSHRPTTQSQ